MTQQYLLGFDVGGTHARSSLIQVYEGSLKILNSQKHSIRAAKSPHDIANLVRHVLKTMVIDAKIPVPALSGIGIAIAGQIDIDECTVIHAPNLDWHQINFARMLRDATIDLAPHLRIRIANDLNAIVWGEYHFGAAQKLSSLLAVYVGTGIGSGIIYQGQLMLGADNVSGEIGHTKFPHLAAYSCGCGQQGCAEAYAGGKSMEYRILHDIQTGVISRAALDLEVDEQPSARAIEKAYREGLPYAIQFWDEASTILGMTIANAISLFNPQGLLLGGGVLAGCPELMTLTIEKIMQYALPAALQRLQLIKPTLHDDAGTLGAALLCLNKTT